MSSLMLRISSRSRKQYSITEIAPMSMAWVPSHTRWLLTRCSSTSSTRIHLTRSGISMPRSFSTDRQYASELLCAAR